MDYLQKLKEMRAEMAKQYKLEPPSPTQPVQIPDIKKMREQMKEQQYNKLAVPSAPTTIDVPDIKQLREQTGIRTDPIEQTEIKMKQLGWRIHGILDNYIFPLSDKKVILVSYGFDNRSYNVWEFTKTSEELNKRLIAGNLEWHEAITAGNVAIKREIPCFPAFKVKEPFPKETPF